MHGFQGLLNQLYHKPVVCAAVGPVFKLSEILASSGINVPKSAEFSAFLDFSCMSFASKPLKRLYKMITTCQINCQPYKYK